MKTIPAVLNHGVYEPSTPIDRLTALSVSFDGTRYTVYEKGDVVPVINYSDVPIANVKTEAELQGLLKNSADLIEFKKYYATITAVEIGKL